MKEVVYSFEEFLGKVDLSKPLHHQGVYECRDPCGIAYLLIFRIYGVSKGGGHIVIFEERHTLTVFNVPEAYSGGGNALNFVKRWAMDLYRSLVKKYALPLKSTEGELRE